MSCMSPWFAGRPGAGTGPAPAAYVVRTHLPLRVISRRRPLQAFSSGARPFGSPLLGAALIWGSRGISRQRNRRRRCGDFLRSEAARRAGGTTASGAGAGNRPRLHRQQALTLQFFASKLAGAADGLRLLPDSSLRGFFVMAAELHLAEDAFPLHLLL